jgi:benzoate-CoA ligase family protein
MSEAMRETVASVGATNLYNATVDLLERNLIPGRAERAYLRVDDRDYPYQEVATAADAAGAGLLGLGLERGDRVIVAMRDRPEFVFAFWGAIKAGLVPVPIAQGLSSSDIQFMVSDSGARAVVFDTSSARVVMPAIAETGAVAVVAGGRVDGARAWHAVCGAAASLAAADTTGEDIALWLYTSGTTGLPKAVMHRQRHLRWAPNGLAAQVLQIEADDVVLSISKMYFAYGLGNSIYLPASAGATVVLNEAPVVPTLVQGLLNRARPTLMFGVPAFFNGFCRLGEAELPDSVRRVVSAGEALSVDLFEAFRERFGRPILDGLGSTEAMHHVTSNRPDDLVPGSAGPALEGFEVKALDRDQEPVGEGESGELWVRGPTTFAGYWRRPELTARVYADGWMRTGDLVRIVEGRVYHEGRLDDLIKLGGVWVAPAEIEDVLRSHEAVTEVAVVAIDEETGVPVLKAFVVADRRDDELRKELARLCRQHLASFKVPQVFELVDELPRTPTGKLRRFVLRKREPTA